MRRNQYANDLQGRSHLLSIDRSLGESNRSCTFVIATVFGNARFARRSPLAPVGRRRFSAPVTRNPNARGASVTCAKFWKSSSRRFASPPN